MIWRSKLETHGKKFHNQDKIGYKIDLPQKKNEEKNFTNKLDLVKLIFVEENGSNLATKKKTGGARRW